METLHLYPSALARDRAIEGLGSAAWTDRHRTFSEFIAELERGMGVSPMRDGNKQTHGQDAHATKSAEGAARLEVIARTLQSHEFSPAERLRLAGSETALAAIADLIAAWKGVGLTPGQIQTASSKLPADSGARETVYSLAKLFDGYEKLLGAWTDREGREQLILNDLAKCQRLPQRVLPRGAAIEVHAFHRLIPFQRLVLERIQELDHTVTIKDTHGPEAHATTFGTLSVERSGPIPAPSEHQRIEAATPYAEVYEIGRQIREWIVNDGVAPADICVAFRDLGTYSQSIGDVFRRFEIPYFERRGEPAAFQPIVRVCLSAVRACAGNLEREDIFRFLNAGVIDVAGLSGDSNAQATGGDLHWVAMESCIDRFFGADVDDPAGAWARRLKLYVESLSVESDAYRARAERLARILSLIIDKLNTMRVPRTLRDHAVAWRKLFSDAGLSVGQTFLADQSVSSLRRKTCLGLQEFFKALDTIAAGPLSAAHPVSLEEFSRSLERAVAERSVRADGAEPGGVRVLNLYDLRGLQFKRLILGGMAEGVFPALSGGHALLGSHGAMALRSALPPVKRAGQVGYAWLLPLSPLEAHAEEEALFQIARAAVAAGGTLVFSRPTADVDGRALGPSTFWDVPQASSLHVSNIGNPARLEARGTASIHPAPKLSECIIPEEIELRAAWVLGGGVADEEERNQAVAVYVDSPRLQQIARFAAIERRRGEFFNAQGLSDDAFDADISSSEIEVKSFGGSYDGIVGQGVPEARQILSDRLLSEPAETAAKARMLSPSAIEKLAACPFRFLVEDVYRFRESRLPEPTLAALDRGSIWHDILSRFYTEQLTVAQQSGRMVAVLDRALEAQYAKALKSIAEKVLEAVPEQAFVGNPGMWRLEQDKIHAALTPWLKHELNQSQNDGFHVACTELSFGMDVSASAVAVPALGAAGEPRELLLQGRMDRLDFKFADPESTVPELLALRVIDYKTGASDYQKAKTKLDTLQALLAVQLPVYLRAAIGFAEALEKQGLLRINRDSLWKNSQAGYYCLKDIPVKNRKDELCLLVLKEWPLGTLERFLSRESVEAGSLFGLLSQMVSEVVQGNFPVKPQECAGKWCAARYVCRYKDVPTGQESSV